MVADDDDDESPSPEPRTDSRSALPREIWAWRRLRVVKRDETFSLIFFPETEDMELELRSVEVQGAHEIGGAPYRGKARPPVSWTGCGPPGLHLWRRFFIIYSKIFRGVLGHSENFYFPHKKQHHGNSAENSVSPG